MRKIAIYSALVLPLAFIDASAAFAQDGSRIVMRRPINDAGTASPSGLTPPTPPAACGTPGNPCVSSCTYSEPYWDYSATDSSVCTGSTGYANATCMASNESGSVISVPDSVCLENVTSYQNRCGNFSGMPGSGPVAGPRPETAPGSMDCTASGVPVVISIGSPRVATGLLGNDGVWRIFGYSAGSTPVCSYPTASPAVVECRVNGVPRDPSNCSVESYSNLYSQNLVPISAGGNTPFDLRTAQWVRPGFELGKCETQWTYTDNPTPPGCGEVTVSRDVSCTATNAQSSNIPEDRLSCDPSTRPDDTFTTTNYDNCSFYLAATSWGPPSSECGTSERTRVVSCFRSDDTEGSNKIALTVDECSDAINSRCATVREGISCGSNGQYDMTETETTTLSACPAVEEDQYYWDYNAYGSWSTNCGAAERTRTVVCKRGDRSDLIEDDIVDDDLCSDSGPKPKSVDTALRQDSCVGTNYCSSGTLLRTFTDSTDVNRHADCASEGASCIEDGYSVNSGVTSHISRCFASTVTKAPDGTNPLTIRGSSYERRNDQQGWCNYSGSGDSPRSCISGATAVAESCTRVEYATTGDTCEGGSVIGTGTYEYRSSGHPSGNFSNGTREKTSGMTTALQCAQAGGNCFQQEDQVFGEQGEWNERNTFYECHAGATSISPNMTYDGYNSSVDYNVFSAGYAQCAAPEVVLYTDGYGIQGAHNGCPGEDGGSYLEIIPNREFSSHPVDQIYKKCDDAGGTKVRFHVDHCTYVTDNYRQDYDEHGTVECIQ